MEYSNVYKVIPAPNNPGIRNWCGVSGDKHIVEGVNEPFFSYIPPHPSMMGLRTEQHYNDGCGLTHEMMIPEPHFNLNVNNRTIFMFLLAIIIVYILYVKNK